MALVMRIILKKWACIIYRSLDSPTLGLSVSATLFSFCPSFSLCRVPSPQFSFGAEPSVPRSNNSVPTETTDSASYMAPW